MSLKKSVGLTMTLILTNLMALTPLVSANQIIEARGRVELKRDSWNTFRPVGMGATLEGRDMLRPSTGANVSVLCSNAKVWTVPPGVISGIAQGCPNTAKISVRGRRSQNFAGGSDLSLPFLISPRYTLIREAQPTFRWNKVDGATTYLVRVTGGDKTWQTEVQGTEVVYAGEALQPEVQYFVTVEADTGKSSLDEGGQKLGFKLLNEQDRQRVSQMVEGINQSSLSAEAKAIAIAQVYTQMSLNVDAIEILQGLVKQGNQSPLVHKMLGDLYGKTGLNLLAEEYYTKAIALASAPEDLEVKTEAQEGLAGVKMMLGKMEEAQKLSLEAKAGYKALGDETNANQVESRLLTLEQQQLANNGTSARIRIRGSSQTEKLDDIVTPRGIKCVVDSEECIPE